MDGTITQFETVHPHLQRLRKAVWVSQLLQAIASVFTLLVPLMSQKLLDEGLLPGNQDVVLVSVM